MPKYLAIAAITLDGKIAKDKNHLSDWTSKEDKAFLHKVLDGCDCIIVGNNTYKTARQPLSKRNCIVLSRSADKLVSKSAKLTYCKPNKAQLTKLLKAKSYKLIAILGGTQTYTYCLKNNMMDELYLTIEPIIFGEGINLFDNNKLNKKFRLVSVKKLNQRGSILLHYIN